MNSLYALGVNTGLEMAAEQLERKAADWRAQLIGVGGDALVEMSAVMFELQASQIRRSKIPNLDGDVTPTPN